MMFSISATYGRMRTRRARTNKIWAAKFTARHPNLVALEVSGFYSGYLLHRERQRARASIGLLLDRLNAGEVVFAQEMEIALGARCSAPVSC